MYRFPLSREIREESLWGAPAAFIINSQVFMLIATLIVFRAPELIRRE